MKAILIWGNLIEIEEPSVRTLAKFRIVNGKLRLEECKDFEHFEEIKKVAYEALDKIKDTKRRDK